MPRKRCATRSRLQNLSKIKKQNKKNNNNDTYGKSFSHPLRSQTFETLLPQMAEPDTLDTNDVPIMSNEDVESDSEGSGVEILDSGSDTDICEESELTKFSRMLSDAQKIALAKEKARGNKRKTYTGHSRTTSYRFKRQRSDLAAQGYLPVHEFMEQMKSQKNTKELTSPQDLTLEESEESSDDDAVTMSLFRSKEPSASECTNVKELTPAVSEDCCQVAPSPAASEDHCPIAQGPAANEDRRQVAQGPTASENRRQNAQGPATSEGRHQVAQGPVASEQCRQAIQGLREEEEESTGSEGEDRGTTREDRHGVASKNGMHLGAALFRHRG
jgi:hypothetical protein